MCCTYVIADECRLNGFEVSHIAITQCWVVRDVVAYFTQSKPVIAKASITAKYNGVEWRFSSEANKALFVANPGKYGPKFGGYCAWAVAHGVTAPGSPQAWSIVGGKLYLNINKPIRAKWKADAATQIKNGNKNWPSVLN